VRGSIRIETPGCGEALDLIDVLARRGLCARVAAGDGGREVELRPGRESVGPLLVELRAALADWLLDRNHAPVAVRVADRVYIVSAEADGQD